ncbi:MAG: MBL fold metallo-hydrolase [Paludibacteraceae bacterium]|nr:MBL fold metallo-hydrolase [Paludibacteraceae bacterium]
MNIKTFYCNPYRECTYIVTADREELKTDQALRPCLIIDPGMYGEREEERVMKYLTEQGLQPAAILITHKHPDHVCGLECLLRQWPELSIIGLKFSMPDLPDQVQEIAGMRFRILATPGHKEDSLCFWFEEENTLFTGDTLFEGSIGRTDLPGGDMQQIIRSLNHLKTLPDCTMVYAGHGYPTTIGREKQQNPYM